MVYEHNTLDEKKGDRGGISHRLQQAGQSVVSIRLKKYEKNNQDVIHTHQEGR